MPQKPTSAFAPSIDVDDSNKYLVELVAMDEQPSQFRDKRKDAMMCTYKFNMWDMDSGEAVIDDNTGEMFELWKITNDLTYDNPATNKIAPGREIANALVGHRLTDEEVNEMLDSGWEDALVGKKAIADVEWAELSDGGQRLRLLRLKPYVKKAKEPAAVGASARRGPRPAPGDEPPF
jgi:hypothetical protein